MEIEVFSSKNLVPLTELTLELWPETNLEEENKQWAEVLLDPKQVVYLAMDAAAYIGFIHVTIRQDYVEGAIHGNTAYIEGIYIKKEFRKKGIASKLLKKAEEWAKQIGLKQMGSDTEIANVMSIDFHNKVGFREVNRTVSFIKEL